MCGRSARNGSVVLYCNTQGSVVPFACRIETFIDSPVGTAMFAQHKKSLFAALAAMVASIATSAAGSNGGNGQRWSLKFDHVHCPPGPEGVANPYPTQRFVLAVPLAPKLHTAITRELLAAIHGSHTGRPFASSGLFPEIATTLGEIAGGTDCASARPSGIIAPSTAMQAASSGLGTRDLKIILVVYIVPLEPQGHYDS